MGTKVISRRRRVVTRTSIPAGMREPCRSVVESVTRLMGALLGRGNVKRARLGDVKVKDPKAVSTMRKIILCSGGFK